MGREDILGIIERRLRDHVEGFTAREFIFRVEEIEKARAEYDENVGLNGVAGALAENLRSGNYLSFTLSRKAALDIYNNLEMDNLISECLSETLGHFSKRQLLSVCFSPRFSVSGDRVIFEVHIQMGDPNKKHVMGMYMASAKGSILYTDEVVKIVEMCLKLGHSILDSGSRQIKLVYKSQAKSASK